MGILICGLNGTGKSTLGKMLADRLGYEFIDNEDLWFPKTDPAYTFSGPRSKEEAVRLLEERISGNHRFVFAAVKGNYGFSWAEKQEIKNELFGEDRFAIEVYPKERKLVDSADVYHLWVFDKKKEMPFGIHPKEYTKAVNRGYSMTEDELKVLKAYYDGK